MGGWAGPRILATGLWWAWHEWALEVSGVDLVRRQMVAVVGTRAPLPSSGQEGGGAQGVGICSASTGSPAGLSVLFCPVG